MRVILLRDVAKIGKRGDVCDVPDGHAQNFLIPRRLVEVATKEALRRHGGALKQKEILTDRSDEAFQSLLAALKDTSVTIRAQANEQGHLFRGLHEKDVVEALAREGYSIVEKEVTLSSIPKSLGEVPVTLTRGTHTGTITLQVVRA